MKCHDMDQTLPVMQTFEHAEDLHGASMYHSFGLPVHRSSGFVLRPASCSHLDNKGLAGNLAHVLVSQQLPCG